jgi:phosphoribosylformylglycinamidine synthase
MKRVKVCVLRTDGTNCDKETAYVFNQVGAEADIVHINSLIKYFDPAEHRRVNLNNYHILAIPGGFSHGDYIASGKVLAEELKRGTLKRNILQFLDNGKLVIGICNGFQVLVKAGFLPDYKKGHLEQTATLTYNDSSRYEDRWVKLASPPNKCIWTKGIESIDLPVAHGEGKFVAPEKTIERLFSNGQVVFQYVDKDGKPTMDFPANPNGSMRTVAGVCDKTGLIFGLMPHPERYNNPNNHHLASLQKVLAQGYVDKSDPSVAERLKIAGEYPTEGKGMQIFRNGVNYALEHLVRR